MSDLKADYARAASLGLEIAVPVLLGAGAGYWLDIQLQSAPWSMVAGLLTGAVTGFWNVYKFLRKKP
ncbi:MAG: AtpZ/AtpI family protein [Candidatus Margulisbacteria bacterium]|nr:AtpZ/AtpI family protein [Candidatus Margulisiibacteriota bacterium]